MSKATSAAKPKTVIIKTEKEIVAEAASTATSATANASSSSSAQTVDVKSALAAAANVAGGQQQIYIIQTADVPVESAEVVVSDDMAVYETVSALEQLSRGQVVTTAADGEQLIQVWKRGKLKCKRESVTKAFSAPYRSMRRLYFPKPATASA